MLYLFISEESSRLLVFVIKRYIPDHGHCPRMGLLRFSLLYQCKYWFRSYAGGGVFGNYSSGNVILSPAQIRIKREEERLYTVYLQSATQTHSSWHKPAINLQCCVPFLLGRINLHYKNYVVSFQAPSHHSPQHQPSLSTVSFYSLVGCLCASFYIFHCPIADRYPTNKCYCKSKVLR